MNLKEDYHSFLREMDDLRRFVGRVQSMLDREEDERLNARPALSEQRAIISDVFADDSPQVFYTAIILTLNAIIDRHLNEISEVLNLPKLTNDVDRRKPMVQRFKLRAQALTFHLEPKQWEEMVGLSGLRNFFAHGKLNQSSRTFITRRGIQCYSASATESGMTVTPDDPKGNRVWLYSSDLPEIIRSVSEFVDAVFSAALVFPS